MRLFDLDDYDTIRQWFVKRQIPSPSVEFLPKIGFIDGLSCAGFLVQTDTPIAYIDFLISNPDINPQERKSSVYKVVFNLIREAKRRGFKSIMATTQLDVVSVLAKEFDFKNIGSFNTFCREIA